MRNEETIKQYDYMISIIEAAKNGKAIQASRQPHHDRWESHSKDTAWMFNFKDYFYRVEPDRLAELQGELDALKLELKAIKKGGFYRAKQQPKKTTLRPRKK